MAAVGRFRGASMAEATNERTAKSEAEHDEDQDREVLVHSASVSTTRPLRPGTSELVRAPADLRCLVTAPETRRRPAPPAAPAGEAPAKAAAEADPAAADPQRRPARRGTPAAAAAPRPTPGRGHVHDVLVVGGGPSGLVVRLLAGRRRLGRGRGGEEGVPPGEDLRRRPDPPVGAPARRHGPRGRAGRRPPLRRPAGPRLRHAPSTCPGPSTRTSPATATSSPGTTSTAWSPSGRPRPGATVWQGTEAIEPDPRRRPAGRPAGRRAARPAPARWCKDKAHRRAPGEVRARYVVVADGANSRFGRALGHRAADRDLAHGHGPARLLHARPATTSPSSSRTSTSATATGNVVPGLRLDLPPGRRPGQRRRRPALDRPALEGRQHHRTLMDAFVDWRPGVVGALAPRRCLGPPTGGKLPMGLSVGPRVGATTLVVGDAGGRHQPVQRRGHRLRLRDRPAGRGLPRRGPVRRRARGLAATTRPASTPPTGSTTGWPGPSSGSSADPS